MTRWQPGDAILVEEYWHGRLWAARPVNVVADDGETLVLWSPGDSRWVVAGPPPGRPSPPRRADWYRELLVRGEWVLTESLWHTPMRWLIRRGDWYAIWIADDGANSWRWYVNLQEPFEETSAGIRAADLILDLVVDADRRWQWKDEHEFDVLQAAGVIDDATAAHVRRGASEAIGRIEAGNPPFDAWSDWQPDPDWPVPELGSLDELSRRRSRTGAD